MRYVSLGGNAIYRHLLPQSKFVSLGYAFIRTSNRTKSESPEFTRVSSGNSQHHSVSIGYGKVKDWQFVRLYYGPAVSYGYGTGRDGYSTETNNLTGKSEYEHVSKSPSIHTVGLGFTGLVKFRVGERVHLGINSSVGISGGYSKGMETSVSKNYDAQQNLTDEHVYHRRINTTVFSIIRPGLGVNFTYRFGSALAN